jgi:hypothetical protein
MRDLTLALSLAVVYVIGLLVTNIYLAGFGSTDFSINSLPQNV